MVVCVLRAIRMDKTQKGYGLPERLVHIRDRNWGVQIQFETHLILKMVQYYAMERHGYVGHGGPIRSPMEP